MQDMVEALRRKYFSEVLTQWKATNLRRCRLTILTRFRRSGKLTRITDFCPWWYDNRALFLSCGVPRSQHLIRCAFPRTLQVAHSERNINSPSDLSIPSKDRFIALGNISRNKSQCYVVVAAKFGKSDVSSFGLGHSIVVDPWRDIIA